MLVEQKIQTIEKNHRKLFSTLNETFVRVTLRQLDALFPSICFLRLCEDDN